MARPIPQKEFARLVDRILLTPKEINDSFFWADKNHQDYVACKLPIFVPEMPSVILRLDLQVHVRNQPMRSSFTLLMGERIFSLDVNPGMNHTNNIGGKRIVIKGTHWTRWPTTIAELDERELEHQQWFNHFLQRANIAFRGRYEYPPYIPEQIGWTL